MNTYDNLSREELVRRLEAQQRELKQLKQEREATLQIQKRKLSDLQDKLDELPAEMESEKQIRLFADILGQSHDEIYAFDKEGYFVFVNKRIIENYTLKEPYTQNRILDINSQYKEEDIHRLIVSLRKKQALVVESKHRLNNGIEFPVELYLYRIEDKYLGELFWCFARDITSRIEQQQHICEMNKLMETILNNIPVAISVKNVDDDYRHVYFNSAAEQFTGMQASHVLGKTDFEVFGDIRYATEIRKQDVETFQQGEHILYATEYMTPWGEKRVVNTMRLLITSDHQPLVISFVWDITDLYKNEIELKKKREANELKSMFLANMSHEIRTPLNAIVGFSSILTETTDEEERKCYMDIIHKNNEILLQLVNDILDYTRFESNEFDFLLEKVDLKDICQHIYWVHSMKVNPLVTMEFDINHLPSVMLYTDSKRIIQVLTNFMTNAIKFTNEGKIILSYEVEDNQIKVFVKDTGIGIDTKYKEVIFDRFVKIDDFCQGTGLGLSISKIIIEKLGGQIGVDSVMGEGSTFWFVLPLTPMDQNESVEAECKQFELSEKQPAVLQSKKTILVAEDVQENYYLLNVLFGKQYNLYHARDGKEAIKLFDSCNPDLVLMDIKMPVMNGFEATKQIRERSQKVPIIALTAFSNEESNLKSEEYKFTDFMIKPLDISSLRKKIHEYI